MGYTVTRGEKSHGHFETKAEAIEEIKKLCRTDRPFPVHISPGGIERYSDPLGNVVSLIPDPPVANET